MTNIRAQTTTPSSVARLTGGVIISACHGDRAQQKRGALLLPLVHHAWWPTGGLVTYHNNRNNKEEQEKQKVSLRESRGAENVRNEKNVSIFSIDHTKQPGPLGLGACPSCNVRGCAARVRHVVILILPQARPI